MSKSRQVIESLSQILGCRFSETIVDVTRLEKEQALIKLVFTLVTISPEAKEFTFLYDIASLTKYNDVYRQKKGCFIINKPVWDNVSKGYYKYWFVVIDGILYRVKKVPIRVLFDHVNIMISKSCTRFLKREIDYSNIYIKIPYTPGRNRKNRMGVSVWGR